MKRARFVQDARRDPGRYYRNPSDIIRDRRLNNNERLEIVLAWERNTQDSIPAREGANGAEEKLDQLKRLRAELEQEAEDAIDPTAD